MCRDVCVPSLRSIPVGIRIPRGQGSLPTVDGGAVSRCYPPSDVLERAFVTILLCCLCPRSPIGRRKQRLAKAGNAKPQAALATVRSHSSRSLLSEADPSTTWPAHKPRSRRDLELGIKRQGSSRRNLLRQSGDSARSLLSSRRPNRAVPLPASGEWCPHVDSWLCGRVSVCVFAWCRCNHLGADVIRAAQTSTDRHASPTAPRTSWFRSTRRAAFATTHPTGLPSSRCHLVLVPGRWSASTLQCGRRPWNWPACGRSRSGRGCCSSAKQRRSASKRSVPRRRRAGPRKRGSNSLRSALALHMPDSRCCCWCRAHLVRSRAVRVRCAR